MELLEIQADLERMKHIRNEARKRGDKEQWDKAMSLIKALELKIDKLFGRK